MIALIMILAVGGGVIAIYLLSKDEKPWRQQANEICMEMGERLNAVPSIDIAAFGSERNEAILRERAEIEREAKAKLSELDVAARYQSQFQILLSALPRKGLKAVSRFQRFSQILLMEECEGD